MIKTRIAPSPTGNLHIGTARSALFNYLFARHEGGKFVLRIEDTDRERSKKEFEEDILGGLEWLGLWWDEMYRQSERSDRYRHYLEQLLDEGRAFYCAHSHEETEGSVHICATRDGKTSSVPGSVIRFKTPLDREVAFNDLVRGEVHFNTKEIGDFAIAKSLNEPLFNFANVIDDEEMDITHVIRGEDHISNTPKHILLRETFGFRELFYAHLPLVLGKDRSKLSKRHGATSLSEFKDEGYLPEALVNMLAFLGWNPGDEREFFTLGELVKEFSLERVKKGGAIFNFTRLNFLNQHYLRSLPLKTITRRAGSFFERRYGDSVLEKVNLDVVVDLERGRAITLQDLAGALDFVFALPSYELSLLSWKDQSQKEVKESLSVAQACVEKIPDGEYTIEKLKEQLLEEAQRRQDKGRLLWPLRVALSGKRNSPGPFEIAYALGKKETLNRIRHALELFGE